MDKFINTEPFDDSRLFDMDSLVSESIEFAEQASDHVPTGSEALEARREVLAELRLIQIESAAFDGLRLPTGCIDLSFTDDEI